MGGLILELILQAIFIYPGAAIRWTFSRLWKSKRTFKDYLNDDFYMNGSIGLMIPAIIIAIINNL